MTSSVLADIKRDFTTLVQIRDSLKEDVDSYQNDSFDAMTHENLDEFNIFDSGELMLASDAISRATTTDSIGAADQWSATGLYRHFSTLEGLVPHTDELEAAISSWINPFFYRATSILGTPQPGGPKLLLRLEENIPPMPHPKTSLETMSGVVDFTAIFTTAKPTNSFWGNFQLSKLKEQDSTFIVLEAKEPDQMLSQAYMPQAICKMYACAKHLGKGLIRGALTNGLEWIFVVLRLNKDGGGGTYSTSSPLKLAPGIQGNHAELQSCSLIAAIIAHWIPRSHEEIDDSDYFRLIMDQAVSLAGY